MKPVNSVSGNLADKIRNIDGKIIKEGKLRTALRGVVQTEPSSFVNVAESVANVVNNGDNSTLNRADDIKGSGDVNKPPFPSFASMLQRNPHYNKKTVKIHELRNPEIVEGAAVALPLEAVEAVSSRFINTLYGYFIGDRLAFPLVENYVKNTWAKYGLKRIQLHENFFMFQFNTKEGMEKVMEDGPWLIRYKPLFLNIWTPNTDLKKDVIKSAPLWVKLHHVPIVAYSEIGLSLITTQLGRPIMLDSYTSNMCLSSWGRNTYARALVEFSADEELKESIVIAIPLCNGKGHTLATIDVEYEWTPPRCASCKVFDHVNENYPKNPKVAVNVKETDDGFNMVTKKNSRPILKQNQKYKQVEGIRLTKPALNLQYRRVDKGDTSKNNDNEKATSSKETPQVRIQSKDNAKEANNDNNITIKNSFGDLTKDEEMERNVNNIINDDSECEEVDEEMVFDDRNGEKFSAKGASTPVLCFQVFYDYDCCFHEVILQISFRCYM
ncbi:zinc knuckle CX2CX4HX4C containing protein [Tanacetum coccineum]